MSALRDEQCNWDFPKRTLGFPFNIDTFQNSRQTRQMPLHSQMPPTLLHDFSSPQSSSIATLLSSRSCKSMSCRDHLPIKHFMVLQTETSMSRKCTIHCMFRRVKDFLKM